MIIIDCLINSILFFFSGCLIEIKDQLFGEIMSPGYALDQHYPNSMECKWNIYGQPNNSYTFKFDSNYDIDTPDDILYVCTFIAIWLTM